MPKPKIVYSPPPPPPPPRRRWPRHVDPLPLGGGGGGGRVGLRLHGPPEHVDDLGHGGALLGVLEEAALGELGDLPGGLDGVLAAEPGVHDHAEVAAVGGELADPLQQLLLPGRPVPVQRPPPRQDLVQHHPEAPHVALHRQVPRLYV
uniref:Uncharacterized protein n=1 Tax=Oryza brachyantha TaxID=4533 RepID=J3MZI5_ORYBR